MNDRQAVKRFLKEIMARIASEPPDRYPWNLNRPDTPAERAIEKLRRNRRLTREELDRPMTI